MGATASKVVEQLGLFRETADTSQEAVDDEGAGPPAKESSMGPTSRTTKSTSPPAMTIEETADEVNLMMAFEKVAKNKGAPGTDRQTVEHVRRHIDVLLPRLKAALLDGSYQPGMIRRVWIPKPGGGQRGLGIPNVVDRLVQQAVHQVLGPHFEPQFHASSHGFRPERSCHTAIAEAKRYLDEGCDWVVDIDLEKFFDRVHHERLLARLEHFGVKDRRLLSLIRLMLKAKVVMPDGVVVNSDEGTPQGGPLSPLLSNIVLDELDWELHRRGHRFVRYADDCNIYVCSERAGQRVMASVVDFIARRLRLKVNVDKSAVARPGTRHFLGFSLKKPKDGTTKVRLSDRSRKRIGQRVVELTPRSWGSSLKTCIEEVNVYLRGWVGFFHIVDDSFAEWNHIDGHIRRRLRAIVLRQKKRRRFMVRWLQGRKVSRDEAERCVYGGHRSLWALSITSAAHKAMGMDWFDQQGLHRLVALWRKWNPKPKKIIAPRQLELVAG
jgi:group II intron reverse transcriptase/maturase